MAMEMKNKKMNENDTRDKDGFTEKEDEVNEQQKKQTWM